jgi:cell division protein FtsB
VPTVYDCKDAADALAAQAARIAELEAENEELKKAISKPWMGSARAAFLGEKE